MNRKKLTDDFFEDEFWSPDKNFAKMEPEFMLKLQRLRTTVGVVFTVSSGYRTAEFNARIGGAPESLHLVGKAADIEHKAWDGATKHKFVSAALALGFSLGIYRKHFHVDTRTGTRVLWIGKAVC
jgi:zinc D-Ala-D-Ala carboxypeptidase